MPAITANREAIIKLIAADITAMNTEWEQGRAASPDQRDYVNGADRILAATLADYGGSTDEGREFLADEIFEDCGDTYVTATDIATFIYDTLTAE